MKDEYFYRPLTEQEIAELGPELGPLLDLLGTTSDGNRRESALMLQNRGLTIWSRTFLEGEPVTNVHSDVLPDYPTYAQDCKDFNVHQPGDTGSREYYRFGGMWLKVDPD
jgi:hypothetical protein